MIPVSVRRAKYRGKIYCNYSIDPLFATMGGKLDIRLRNATHECSNCSDLLLPCKISMNLFEMYVHLTGKPKHRHVCHRLLQTSLFSYPDKACRSTSESAEACWNDSTGKWLHDFCTGRVRSAELELGDSTPSTNLTVNARFVSDVWASPGNRTGSRVSNIRWVTYLCEETVWWLSN